MHGSVSRTNHALDGIAVVSAIVASSHPRLAAEQLLSIFRSFNVDLPPRMSSFSSPEQTILDGVIELIEAVHETNPLVHQVQNTIFPIVCPN